MHDCCPASSTPFRTGVNRGLRHSPRHAACSRYLRGISMLPTLLFTLMPVGILALVLVLKSFGINQEYERGVVFRLGRLQATKGPGWFWLIPIVERVVKVDIRTITYALDTQETVTRDGVAVRVNAVLWFRAFDAAGVVTT